MSPKTLSRQTIEPQGFIDNCFVHSDLREPIRQLAGGTGTGCVNKLVSAAPRSDNWELTTDKCPWLLATVFQRASRPRAGFRDERAAIGHLSQHDHCAQRAMRSQSKSERRAYEGNHIVPKWNAANEQRECVDRPAASHNVGWHALAPATSVPASRCPNHAAFFRHFGKAVPSQNGNCDYPYLAVIS